MPRSPLVYLGTLSIILGSGPSRVWTHPSKHGDDFTRDRYECLKEARVMLPGTAYVPQTPPAYGGGSPGAAAASGFAAGFADASARARTSSRIETDTELFDACMQARGWKLEPATE
jgi:hypothetical protein